MLKHYHQWLRSAIHFKTKSGQIPSDSVRMQGPSKRSSSGHLYPVSSVKERNRKGGKCKISRVLQLPVSSPQASPKVEASNRLKQAQHFSTCRKVQNGNSRVHQDLPDSRGMGIVDRPVRRLSSHPHPPKLKEIPKVLPQVTGVPVHLPPFRTSHSPPGLYNDCKGSEPNGPLEGTWTSPIPGLADQVPVSGGSPSEHSGSGRPNPISQPLCLVSRSGQLQEQGLSVEVAERIAAPERSSTRTIYKSKSALFEKWCRENSVDFSTPSVKQVSDFFMYLYQNLNRRPSTIDGYRTAIVDTLGPAGHHISQSSDLHRLLSSFHREKFQEVPGIFQHGTFLLYSMSSQKHPLSL